MFLQLFIRSISLFSSLIYLLPTARAVTTNDPSSFSTQKFDYLVVGGGTAGLALATRLSEDSSLMVGVLEAGTTAKGVTTVDVPGMLKFGRDLPTIYNWNYTTEPGSNGVPSIPWPRGKVVGGSSALNFLVWDRASENDYNAIEKLGNPGWNWSNLFKYMKKAETWTAPSSANEQLLGVTPSSQFLGNSGPVQVSFGNYVSKASQTWIPALESLSISKNNNPLSGNNLGVNQSPSDIRPSNQSRSYSAPAYYYPIEGIRSNLVLITDALVQKVNFAQGGSPLRATGVTFSSGGNLFNVTANKEVILCGGSVNTPQILELSGIGQKEILDKFGIPQLLELPVGENLQEHTYTSVTFSLTPGTITLDSTANPAFGAQQLQLWETDPPSSPSVFDQAVPSLAYITLQQLAPSNASAWISAVQQYVAASGSVYKAVMQQQLQFLADSSVAQMELIAVDGYFATTGSPEPNTTYITFLAANQHPFSRGDYNSTFGSIHIASNSPAVPPAIQPNYFTVPFDLNLQAAGTQKLLDIAKSSPYAAYLKEQVVPPAGETDLADYSKQTLSTEFHPIGTASMLPQNKGGVVNTSLIVYGTSNLRVVDASILPIHISSHLQATVYGIAEMAADIIKGDFVPN